MLGGGLISQALSSGDRIMGQGLITSAMCTKIKNKAVRLTINICRFDSIVSSINAFDLNRFYKNDYTCRYCIKFVVFNENLEQVFKYSGSSSLPLKLDVPTGKYYIKILYSRGYSPTQKLYEVDLNNDFEFTIDVYADIFKIEVNIEENNNIYSVTCKTNKNSDVDPGEWNINGPCKVVTGEKLYKLKLDAEKNSSWIAIADYYHPVYFNTVENNLFHNTAEQKWHIFQGALKNYRYKNTGDRPVEITYDRKEGLYHNNISSTNPVKLEIGQYNDMLYILSTSTQAYHPTLFMCGMYISIDSSGTSYNDYYQFGNLTPFSDSYWGFPSDWVPVFFSEIETNSNEIMFHGDLTSGAAKYQFEYGGISDYQEITAFSGLDTYNNLISRYGEENVELLVYDNAKFNFIDEETKKERMSTRKYTDKWFGDYRSSPFRLSSIIVKETSNYKYYNRGIMVMRSNELVEFYGGESTWIFYDEDYNKYF